MLHRHADRMSQAVQDGGVEHAQTLRAAAVEALSGRRFS